MMVRLPLCFGALLMLLMGCAEPQIEYRDRPVPVSVFVPESLRECPQLVMSTDYITATSDEEAYQSQVALYVAALHRVARTCRANLNGIDDVLDQHEAEITPIASAIIAP
jgi:hypothetical protein